MHKATPWKSPASCTAPRLAWGHQTFEGRVASASRRESPKRDTRKPDRRAAATTHVGTKADVRHPETIPVLESQDPSLATYEMIPNAC